MPAGSRHAKPKKPVTRFGAPIVAAVVLAGAAAAFVLLQGGPADAGPSHHAARVTSTRAGLADDLVATTVRRDAAVGENRMIQRERAAARRRHLAKLAAARRAQQAAAQPSPSPSTSTSPTPSGTGGNAADSPLGVCIRDAEEGGSYAWGPGNGGGAYQFALGTWEHYGGAASEFGAAGAAYQDQIFDNAIAAGGASNWTDYDGC
jgi:hypothetical protein